MRRFFRIAWIRCRLMWSILLGRPTGYRILVSGTIEIDEDKALLVACSAAAPNTLSCFAINGKNCWFVGCYAYSSQIGYGVSVENLEHISTDY